MADATIENPILNTPFAEPSRHFRFGDEGITDEIVEGRRPSSYFLPIPAAKKKAQLQMPDWTLDRLEETRLINDVRRKVGELRPSSVGDIACWMIDTDYDGESFFVRHAHFLGADEPYANLKRARRAEIDEEAWASLYRARSRPFDPPPRAASP